ncbi:MAG: hypothetical protein U9P44_02365 [archaeon]|nr:hypothetical protein [archaeon]
MIPSGLYFSVVPPKDDYFGYVYGDGELNVSLEDYKNHRVLFSREYFEGSEYSTGGYVVPSGTRLYYYLLGGDAHLDRLKEEGYKIRKMGN